MARLLAPNDFGLFGIALLSLAIIETFSRTGFKQALIQKKTDIKLYLNTAWTVGIVRGLLIATALFIAAPHVATFFNEPSAEPLIKIVGLTLILQAFANIAIIYFEKELEFQKFVIYQFTGTIINVIVTIIAAIILRSAWALVLGVLAANFTKLIISYFIDRYRPKPHLDFKKIKELFNFGKWILGSSILFFFLTQGDGILVGKILGAAALGLYQMAYRISNMPTSEYSRLIVRVTFPAYSKLQDNLAKLNEAYLKVFQLTTILSIPIGGLIFMLSPEFTNIFLGEKWMLMVPAVQILAFYGMIRAIGGTTQPLFSAIGRPDITTKIKSGQLILLAILIYPFTSHWGIVGTSIAVATCSLIFNFTAVCVVSKRINSDYKKIMKLFGLPLISSSAMVFALFIAKTYFLSDINVFSFFLLIGIGMLIFIAVTYIFDRYFNFGGIKLVQDQLSILLKKYKTKASDQEKGKAEII